jgi:hypothetical protein
LSVIPSDKAYSTNQPDAATDIAQASSCQTFRQSFVTRPLERDYDIRTVQELLGYAAIRIAIISTPILNRTGTGVRNPHDSRDRVLHHQLTQRPDERRYRVTAVLSHYGRWPAPQRSRQPQS